MGEELVSGENEPVSLGKDGSLAEPPGMRRRRWMVAIERTHVHTARAHEQVLSRVRGFPWRIRAGHPHEEQTGQVLDVARRPADLDLPGYCLHPLKGDLKGMWSVTISGNWRMIFRFENGDAFDVDLVDYH